MEINLAASLCSSSSSVLLFCSFCFHLHSPSSYFFMFSFAILLIVYFSFFVVTFLDTYFFHNVLSVCLFYPVSYRLSFIPACPFQSASCALSPSLTISITHLPHTFPPCFAHFWSLLLSHLLPDISS